MTREHRLLPLIAGGLMLIAIAALSAWFFTNFERVTREIPVGASPGARRNPLLAAEHFLSRLGMQVESVAGRQLLRDLPPPTDTLVVRGLGPMTDSRQAALRDWIEQGGRLVVEATAPWDEDSASGDFLSDFGIWLLESADDDPDAGDNETQVLIDTAEGVQALTLSLQQDWYLECDDEEAVRIEAGGKARATQLAVGEGLLSAFSDTVLFTNASIADHDHALFLAHLADPGPGGKVWLIYDSSVPWLGALLWGAIPHALTAGLVMLVAWAWSLGTRLGPLEAPPDRQRRDLLEHMDATGGFLWRQGLGSHLVGPSRRRILAAWERHHPRLRHLDQEARVRGISEAAGRPLEGVEQALSGAADGISGFVRQAARLQSLWLGARPGHRGQTHQGRTGKAPGGEMHP